MRTIRLTEEDWYALLFSLGYAMAAVRVALDGTPQVSNAVLRTVNAIAERDSAFVPYRVENYETDPTPQMVKILRRMADDLEGKWQQSTKSTTRKSKRGSSRSGIA